MRNSVAREVLAKRASKHEIRRLDHQHVGRLSIDAGIGIEGHSEGVENGGRDQGDQSDDQLYGSQRSKHGRIEDLVAQAHVFRKTCRRGDRNQSAELHTDQKAT